MARFSGAQPGYKVNGNKGVMRKYKFQKRQEAEARNAAYRKKMAELALSQQGIQELQNEQFTVKMPHLEAPMGNRSTAGQ